MVRAVDAGVAETDDLDWKRALPPEVETKRPEFAKDIAAMANTRGGLIVHGVREENERAVGLTGVPDGERDRQALRSSANRYARPLVDGLLIEALDGEDADRAQSGAVCDAAAGDDRGDAAGTDQAAVLVVVVASVGVEPPRPTARLADHAPDRWHGVEQRDQPGDVIAV